MVVVVAVAAALVRIVVPGLVEDGELLGLVFAEIVVVAEVVVPVVGLVWMLAREAPVLGAGEMPLADVAGVCEGSFFLKNENKLPCFNVLPLAVLELELVLAAPLVVVLGLPLPIGDLRLVPERGDMVPESTHDPCLP